MRIIITVLTIMIVAMFVGSAFAVPPGKTVDFDNPNGKVVFDGKVHADKGMKCGDCHTKIFKMKKGAEKITMVDMNAGKNCGTCHNGEKAFKSSDAANCGKCHKK